MKSFDEQKAPASPPPPPRRPSMWKLGGLTWRVLARRVWLELYEGTLLTHAAALSFYFFLALFPLLFCLLTMLGFFTEKGTDLRAELLLVLGRVVPNAAFTLIYATVDEIAMNADSGKLSFGLLAALWVASSGIGAVTEALNAMYGVRESRQWWRVRLASIGLTVALAILIVSALVLLLYGGEISERVSGYFGQNSGFAAVWVIAQIPFILFFVLFSFALIYYFAPNLYDQKWYWITPGSVAGVILWLLVSFFFRLYLRHFDSYSLTYGSLGAVIVLMLWFYLTGVAILVGGKINAEIEGVAAKVGVPGAKHHGEKEAEE